MTQEEHIDDVQATQGGCTDKHMETKAHFQLSQVPVDTDVKGVYHKAQDHGESNSEETEWPCCWDTQTEEAFKLADFQAREIDSRDSAMGSIYTHVELEGGDSELKNAQCELNLGQGQKPDTEIENNILVQNVVTMEALDFQDTSGVSEVGMAGCETDYSLNFYSDSLGFLDFASLDSEMPFITQSPDLIELQMLLKSINTASGHTLSGAQVSSPGGCAPHIELCQETATDLCDHSLDTPTWGEDGLSEATHSTWTNAFLSLSNVSGGPLASSNLLDMSLGEEWFDFSSFVTSSGVDCSPSQPASLSCCLMQESPQRGAGGVECVGTAGELGFGKDELYVIDGGATDLGIGLTSESLGCVTSDPRESICMGDEIVDGCVEVARQRDNTSAYTDAADAESSCWGTLHPDQTKLRTYHPSSTPTCEDVLVCSQSGDISTTTHSALTITHWGPLAQADVIPPASVSMLEQEGASGDAKWRLQEQGEERGASVSRVDRPDAPDVVELFALPVCSEAVGGSPGKSVGVGTVPLSTEGHSAPRKPLVPYHLLDRQRRSLPGTECHKTSYFMDYLMFSGGGAYYNQLAQIFHELYVPTFRLKRSTRLNLKFFCERKEYFILYEVPGGHFIRLRTLSHAPESTLSAEAKKCGFIAAACHALVCEDGIQVDRLKRISSLMRRIKLLDADMLQVLQNCPDFFIVSRSTDSGHCVSLTSKAASVQKEFLPNYKHGFRRRQQQGGSKTQRLMPTLEVTSLCVRREATLQPLMVGSKNSSNESPSSTERRDEIGKGIVGESCKGKFGNVPMDASGNSGDGNRPKVRSMLKWAISNALKKDKDELQSVETSVSNCTAECDRAARKDDEKPKERSSGAAKKVKFQIFSDTCN